MSNGANITQSNILGVISSTAMPEDHFVYGDDYADMTDTQSESIGDHTGFDNGDLEGLSYEVMSADELAALSKNEEEHDADSGLLTIGDGADDAWSFHNSIDSFGFYSPYQQDVSPEFGTDGLATQLTVSGVTGSDSFVSSTPSALLSALVQTPVTHDIITEGHGLVVGADGSKGCECPPCEGDSHTDAGHTHTQDSALITGDGIESGADAFAITGIPDGQDFISALLGTSSQDAIKWDNVAPGQTPVAGTGVNISFQINHTDNPGGYGSGSSLSASEEAAVRASLEMWSNYTNITFTEVSNGSADIDFYKYALPSFGGGSFMAGVAWTSWYSSGGKIASSEVNLTNHTLTYSEGSNGWATVIHEIGHSLGLKHPGDYNGNGSGTGPFLPVADDTNDLSVMSYINGTYTAGSTEPSTAMLYDIAAIQYLYGKNTSYNSGDTTISLTGASKVWTVWDGAGSDTLDSSAYGGNSTLDLREGKGYISHVGSEHLWIALGANIENARGGSGNDTLYGNGLGNLLQGGNGADTLWGGAGTDYLQGGAGNDVYLLTTGDGSANTITDTEGTNVVRVNGNTLTGEATNINETTWHLEINGVTHVLTQSSTNLFVSIQGGSGDSWVITNFDSSDFGFTLETINGQVLTGTVAQMEGSGMIRRYEGTSITTYFNYEDVDNDGVIEFQGTFGGEVWTFDAGGAGWGRYLYDAGGFDDFQFIDTNNNGTAEFFGIWSPDPSHPFAAWAPAGTLFSRDVDGTWSRLDYAGTGATEFQMVDIDNDGTFEFAGYYAGTGVRIYDPNTSSWTTFAEYGAPDKFQFGDMDGDGDMEFVGLYNGSLRQYDPDTSAWSNIPYTHGIIEFQLQDMNNDGDVEILGLYDTGVMWQLDIGDLGYDNLVGTTAADMLNGQSGDDTLTGNGGNDVFVFNGSFDHDTITDWSDGDRIMINYLPGVTSAAHALAATSYANGNAVIDFSFASITIENIAPGTLDADDFIF